MTVIVNIITDERGTVINVEISNSKRSDKSDNDSRREERIVGRGDSAPYSPTHSLLSHFEVQLIETMCSVATVFTKISSYNTFTIDSLVINLLILPNKFDIIIPIVFNFIKIAMKNDISIYIND